MAINIEKRNTRQNTWQKENKERINILFDKGTKDRIKLGADKLAISSSEFIRQAIEEKLYKLGIEKKIAVQDPENEKTIK